LHELLMAVAPAAVGTAASIRGWLLWRLHRRRNAAPGAPAPSFDLQGSDGHRHALEDFTEPALVLVFMSNRCPGVKAYDGRLRRLQQRFAGRLRIVGINPVDEHLYPDESLAGMRIALQERGLDLVYLKDRHQATMHDYGALCTPHVFLLDAQRRIRYEGRIDDALVERNVRKRYLEDAVAAVLGGRRPKVTRTMPLGCSIDATASSVLAVGEAERGLAA